MQVVRGLVLRRCCSGVHATFSAARLHSTEAAASAAEVAGDAVTKNGVGRRDTLARRLLSLTYNKRSAVITIRKWKEEGHTVRKYELNRIVRELRKMNRYKHSLEVCEWMTLQHDIKLQPGDYAVHLDLITKVRGCTSAEKFFEDLPEKMRGQETCTALLHTYAQNKLSDKAEALMEKMSECGFLRNALPYNHMISLYISNGQLEKVPGMIQELKRNTSPDTFTYNLWLTFCALQDDIETAQKVVDELKKKKIDPDWVTYGVLTKLYVKNEFLEKAASTLQEMETKCSMKNRSPYTSLLTWHAKLKNKDEVHRIWKKMKSCFRKIKDAEYTCMISSLLKLGELKESERLYAEWESVSGPRDMKDANILLAGYINNDQMEKAENFFQRVVGKGMRPSYTTWELLTWGYLKTEQLDKALDCCKKAVESVKQWNPDGKMVREVWKILEERGSIAEAEQLLDFLRNTGYVSTEIYNSLLRTYAKAGKMPLIIVERMNKDNVQLDEDTHNLIKLTSTMCVSEIPVSLS